MKNRYHSVRAALATVAAFSITAFAQCVGWRPGPLTDIPGVTGNVYTATTWDPDGSGPLPPQLVIAGDFTAAGSTVVNRIARWDGAAWQPFAGGMTFANGDAANVAALVVLPPSFGSLSGQLVAAGYFDTANGAPAANIARWNGSTWIPLATSFSVDGGIVSMIAPPSDAGALSGRLIVGGVFDSVNGVFAKNIASFNGSSWSRMSSLDGVVRSLTMWDADGPGPLPSRLVASGSFLYGNVAQVVNFVAEWIDPQWAPLGIGLFSPDYTTPPVTCIATVPAGNGPFAGQLVAGGYLTLPGGFGIARNDGTQWNPFGSGVNGRVFALGAWDSDGSGPLAPQLVAAGQFTRSDGNPISPNIMTWSGSAWQSVGAGFDGPVGVVAQWAPTLSSVPHLVAAGFFQKSGSTTLNGLAHFDGTSWQSFSQQAPGAQVRAFANFAGRLVAGGTFTVAGGGTSPVNIAAWDGANITAFGTGFSSSVRALKTYSFGFGVARTDVLVAGGDFSSANGAPANRIAVWSETLSGFVSPWQAMGPGFNNSVSAIERFNNLIVAAGAFTATSTGSTLNHIAMWNGTNWVQLGTGLNGTCNALKVYNGALYAGGAFTQANGINTGGLARWDGTSWSAVGGVFSGSINALEVFGNDLAIGGTFAGIAGTNSPNLMRYNSGGNFFSNVGTGGADATVFSLASELGFLYAGGAFSHIGGVSASRIGRWNNLVWAEVQGGASSFVFALAGFHQELNAGGNFSSVNSGTINSSGWARYFESGTPWLEQNPFSTDSPCGSEAQFSVRIADGYSPTYSWQFNGAPLVDGATASGSIVQGAQSPIINISNLSPADAGSYNVFITSTCGNLLSSSAHLTITSVCCIADFNGDGGVDGADVGAFFDAWQAGKPFADVNDDGGIDGADVDSFFTAWETGAC